MGAILPGDVLRYSVQGSMILGPGFTRHHTSIQHSPTAVDALAMKAGLAGEQESVDGRGTRAWIQSGGKRYIPAMGEPLVGIVVAKHAEGYKIDIGSHHSATLDALAFEGATKRSRPNLKIGAIVYARVSLAQPFADTEIECLDEVSRQAQGYGELQGGMVLRGLPLSDCRALLSSDNNLLPSLGSRFPFECAIGLNGRIWIKAAEVTQMVDAIREIQQLTYASGG